MSYDQPLPRWRDPAYRAEITTWVHDRLAAAGRPVTGEEREFRAWAWSLLVRFPTADGEVWFKACARGMAQEAALLDGLSRWVPDRVLQPIAVDVDRGWLLLPDGGRTLREERQGRTDFDDWLRILVEYAQLQRAVEPFVAEMLALGVPDNRPEALPRVRAALLAADPAPGRGRPAGLTAGQLRRQSADTPAYERMCAELAASGVPASLNHDDLHDHNVFMGRDASRPFRVFDWGDATVAHPFGVLLVSLRFAAEQMGLSPGAPELLRLRDAYLEPWTDEHDVADLREACRLAVRVGGVARADCFRRAMSEAFEAAGVEDSDFTSGWLEELYQPTALEPKSPVG